MTKPVVGVDVGKEKLDVGVASEKGVRVWANDEAGRGPGGRQYIKERPCRCAQ